MTIGWISTYAPLRTDTKVKLVKRATRIESTASRQADRFVAVLLEVVGCRIRQVVVFRHRIYLYE